MDWFEIWYNICNLLLQGVLHISFSGKFTGKKAKVWHFLLYLLCLFGIHVKEMTFYSGGQMSAAAVSSAVDTGIVLLLCCTANHFMLGNDWIISGITAVLAVYVPWLCYGIINSAEMLMFPYILGKIQAAYAAVTAAMAAAMLLSVFCYKLILYCFSFQEMRIRSYIQILFPVCVFFFAAEFYIHWSAYGNVTAVPLPENKGKPFLLFFLQAAGLTALLATLYAYRRACEGVQAQLLVSSLTQEVQAQKKYVEEAGIRYRNTKALRHDMKNHLSVLAGLIKTGNTEQAKEYIHKLEIITGELSLPCQTGNTVVDILLGEKLGLAETKGIETGVSVIFPEGCGADSLDLCVIFANALDNAMQACENVDRDKYIHIIGECQGDFYMIEFENSCVPGACPAPGTGLSNIKAAAEKYKGAVLYEKTHACFRLNVLLELYNGESIS